ncbi:hypothetical protein ACFQ2K_09235 [Streptomyces sanglieri]|uniref:Integrase n=1 Tax=Streptomyces sanglieri TaxID=193460 RepID=A0ABW2WNI5_9ACTN
MPSRTLARPEEKRASRSRPHGRAEPWVRTELATCRKFAPTARNYTASKRMSQLGLRVSEACKLDLADIKWVLGRFDKLHVCHGKGARGSGR